MASLHKDPRGKSPFWYVAFYGSDGARKFRSTKTKDRRAANKIALLWETAADNARKHELTAAQVRKVLSEFVFASSGEVMEFHTVEGWMTEWLTNKAGGASANTMARYRQVIRDFLASLGARSSASVAAVSPSDIVIFRDLLRKEGRAVSTCNVVVKKILSVPFEQARKLGYIPTNPVAAVELLHDKDESRRSGREPFTAEEVSRLVSLTRGDWRGAVLAAATTGLRLGDVANLRWATVDLDGGLLRTQTQKTGAQVVLPIHSDLKAWLATRPRGSGSDSLFPELAGKRTGGCRGLSAQFREQMDMAGIVSRVVERVGKGRRGHNKGFHSLRHTFISALANVGVAPDIRQKLAGHADPKVHARYTHHEIEILRDAVSRLPRICTP